VALMNEGEIAAGLAPTSNYRYADLVGDRLFVAGQVPVDADNNMIGDGDPAAQARQCILNLFTLVAHHGFSRDDIHQLTVYVVGSHENLIAAWREVVSGFGMNVPPATLLGVTVLGHRGQLVEIDAVVAKA
jgi:enamine deaminase RidA (YjgF/YER057c/UK114 family)